MTSTAPDGPPSLAESSVRSDAGASTPASPAEKGVLDGLFSSSLTDNPYFSAGFGLMLFGAALGIGRKGITVGASATQRRMVVSLEITSKDRAYPWFLYWMGKQAEAASWRQIGLLPALPKEGLLQLAGVARPPRYDAKGKGKADGIVNPLALSEEEALQPVRIFSHELAVETSSVPENTVFTLVPGPGTHFFRYDGTWMRMQRERAERMTDPSTGRPFETVTLSTLRSSSYLFPRLLSEARQLAMTATQGKTTIYTSWSVEWRPFGKPRRPRELSSVILAKGIKEGLVSDMQHFLDRGKWYAERGIPYRRGYLLHGAPGSGKSSFIMALAGHLDYNICLLNLSERGMTDDRLTHLMTNAPERSIILLEDIDAAFAGRQLTAEDGYQANVTFSGLLNALDGVASGESRIVFMTTNHADRLDPALIRPGRADVIAELGDAEPEQVQRLVTRFYRSLDEPDLEGLARQLSDIVEQEAVRRRTRLGLDPSGRRESTGMGPRPAASGGVSMAELQGLFIRFPDDPRAAIQAFQSEASR